MASIHPSMPESNENNNYNGVLSIEFEGIEDPLTGIEIGFENLKSYVEQVFKD